MSNLSFKSFFAAVAVAGALVLPAMAQELPPAKLTLVAANGDTFDYTASDTSLYASTNSYEGSSTTDFSMSLSTIAPLDARLLEWASQKSVKNKAQYDLILTTSVPGADGEDRELSYEVSGATVTSFSTNISTYAASTISVSLTGGKLVMDGVPMN